MNNNHQPTEEEIRANQLLQNLLLQTFNSAEINSNSNNLENGDFINDEDQYQQLLSNLVANAGSDMGKLGTSEYCIQELDFIIIDKKDIEKYKMCSICQFDYDLGDELKKLPCSHSFHTDCIVVWLKENIQCPVCRNELHSLDPEHEQKKREAKQKDKFEDECYVPEGMYI